MTVRTAANRRSVQGYSLAPVLPAPDSVVSAADRRAAGGVYAFEADASTITIASETQVALRAAFAAAVAADSESGSEAALLAGLLASADADLAAGTEVEGAAGLTLGQALEANAAGLLWLDATVAYMGPVDPGEIALVLERPYAVALALVRPNHAALSIERPYAVALEIDTT